MSASSTMSRGNVADGVVVDVGWSLTVSSSDWIADEVDSVDCDCIETRGRGDATTGDFRVGGDGQVASPPPTRTSGWVAARAIGDGAPPGPRDDGDARAADCSDGELPLRIIGEHKPDVCIFAKTYRLFLLLQEK